MSLLLSGPGFRKGEEEIEEEYGPLPRRLRVFKRNHFADFSSEWLEFLDLTPEELRAKPPSFAEVWLQEQRPEEVEALQSLLEENDSLQGTLAAINGLVEANRLLMLREERFELDPLLRRRCLKDMDENHMQILIIALQNELSACYELLEHCNLEKHPLLRKALEEHGDNALREKLAKPLLRTNLDELFKAKLLARFSTQNQQFDEQEPPSTESNNQSFQEAKVAGESMIRAVLQELQDIPRIVEDYDFVPDAQSHPASWVETRRAKLLERRDKAIFNACQALIDMRDHVQESLRVCRDVVRKRDETIQMQQQVEKRMMKAKQAVHATNLQLGSLVGRLLEHAYPSIWRKMRLGDHISDKEWEETNAAWLNRFRGVIQHQAPEETTRESLHAYDERADDRGSSRVNHLADPCKWMASRYAKFFLALLEERRPRHTPKPPLTLNFVMNFAHDVGIIPQLVTPEETSFFWGFACSKHEAHPSGKSEDQNVFLVWIDLCANSAFKHLNVPSSRHIESLAKSIDSNLKRKNIPSRAIDATIPTKPRTTGPGTRTNPSPRQK